MPFSVGDKLGHYEVLSLLGQGGMGEVYRARDTTLKRDVALKVLPVAFVRDVERMARFQREAEVLASLDHPNIGPIHGIVVFEDSRGLVLALIDGPTLADRIKAGPLPLEEANAISKQIIEALEYAHDRGVVHRDLKPANIKITSDGVVKVLDFGLAKVLEDEPASSSPSLMNSPTLTMGHTRAGMILGTAAYMSPEQAVGRSVDRRSDIFSFGAVLYEMLSGQLAFPGATTPDVLEGVVKNDPDWSALPSDTPAYLRRLLERTLVKDRKTRLQAIGEARIALQQASDDPDFQATKTVQKSGILWPLLTAASLAIAAGVLAWTYLRPVPVPEMTRFEIHAPPGTTLPLGTPAVSPDGRTIAFVAADKEQIRRIYVRTLDSVEARVLPGTDNAIHPFFSPDGRSLGFVGTGNKLTRVDLAGGVPRTLADVGGPWHGSWSQNGTILFTASGVRQISANGGSPTLALSAASHPYFLPDGKRFLARNGSKIELDTLGSQDQKLVLDNADSAAFIAPTPDGPTYMFYMRSSTVMAQPFDEAKGTLAGEPTVILDNVGRVANPALTPTLGVSRSGTLAFQKSTSGGLGHLTWYDRAGKAISELPSQSAGRDPALSPDGRFAAILRMDPSLQTEDIWVIDLKRGTSSRLTFDKERERNPVWSPDGKRVMFHRNGTGVMEKDASGAGDEIMLLPGGPALDRSPDGKYLLQAQGSARPALVPGPANGTADKKPIPVGSVNGRSTAFQFSPDGKYISYASDESGRNEVYVQPTPPGTGRWQVSVNGGSVPRWRRDGKELFFASASGSEITAVDVVAGGSFSAGTPHVLFRGGQGTYSVSADGQRFLIYSDESIEADSPIIVVQNWWAALRK